MSNGQTKRVNLTLHLSPGDSLADLRTVKQLQQWYDRLKLEDESRENATMEIRRFHRNNYLAGLQLQLLSPKLCHHIAESMGRETLTMSELVGELVRCELLPEGTPVSVPASNDFSTQQLKQLQLLLEKTLPELLPEPSVIPEPLSGKEVGSTEELSRLRAEIERMNTLLEQQNLQLQQLRRLDKIAPASESVRNNQAEEIALSDLSGASEKMKKIRQKGIF